MTSGWRCVSLRRSRAGPRRRVAFRETLRDGGDGPADLAAFVRTFSTVGGGEFPELHQGELVSGNFFAVLGVQSFLGRTIVAFDNVTPGAHPVIVLSHMLWRTQFVSDPDVLGRDVLLDGRTYEVIGVAPPGFRGPVWPTFESAFWIPAMMAADDFGSDEYAVFEGAALPVFQTVGRVRDGRRIEALQARIDPLAEVLARERIDSPYFPDTGEPWRVAVLPGNYLRLWPEYREPVARVLLALGLMAVAGLLVGCANLATLLIARGVERRRELAIRRALGAGALDLARRLGAEVALLVAAGGTVAVGLVYALSPLVPLLPLGVPYELDLVPDRRVLGYGIAAAALAAVLFASLPLVQVLRDRTTLAVGERTSTTGDGGVRAMNGLVIVQVALSVVLLASCGLIVKSALQTAAIDPGFHAERGLSARVTVPGSVPAEARAALFGALVERLRNEPFVEAASVSTGAVVWFESALAAVAAGLALIGLYGLMGYVVGQREREFGIRATLGATPAAIVRLVLRRAERLTAAGLILGIAASLAATRGLAGLLYQTDPWDPPTLAAAAVVLGTAAMFAAFAPARRAAQVDPATVLRAE